MISKNKDYTPKHVPTNTMPPRCPFTAMCFRYKSAGSWSGQEPRWAKVFSSLSRLLQRISTPIQLSNQMNVMRCENAEFKWDKQLQVDLEAFKKELSREPLRAYTDFNKGAEPFQVTTDWSANNRATILSRQKGEAYSSHRPQKQWAPEKLQQYQGRTPCIIVGN